MVESHEHAGGCAHSFERRTKEGTFVFDSGPSLWSGMSAPSVNPLRQVLRPCVSLSVCLSARRCRPERLPTPAAAPTFTPTSASTAAAAAAQVLDVVGESSAIEWKEYDGWGMLLPQVSPNSNPSPDPSPDPNPLTGWGMLLPQGEVY